MMDERTKEQLENRYYPTLDEVVFGSLHRALAGKELEGATVLDAGCGKGTWILRPYKGRFRFVVGVDVYVAPKCRGNPCGCPADAFSLASLESLPFRNASFDLVMCYLVLEHVPHPDRVLAEFARILKPGGTLIFKTPAAYAPTTWLARLLPYNSHCSLKRLVGTQKDDVFPTYYRCNTLPALRHLLDQAGFVCGGCPSPAQLIQVDQTYAYLSFSKTTYILGLLYSRATQHPWLGWLRNGIVGICRKGRVEDRRGQP